MTFSEQLKNSISAYHLLSHPFYQAWNEGEIPKEKLKEYVRQYYNHVKAFPRYISATHSHCDNIEKRRILLENLADEEGLKGEHHPELWLRFAEGMNISRREMEEHPTRKSIENVLAVFFSSARSSYEEGLASLYAYEYQVPEIAETKIKGLKEHYDINDERSLSFFTVHKSADIHHRRECENLIDAFPKQEQAPALKAASESAKALWDFLSDIQECDKLL